MNELVQAVKDVDGHVTNIFIMSEDLLTDAAMARFRAVLADAELLESFEDLSTAEILAINVLLMRILRKKYVAALEAGKNG